MHTRALEARLALVPALGWLSLGLNNRFPKYVAAIAEERELLCINCIAHHDLPLPELRTDLTTTRF